MPSSLCRSRHATQLDADESSPCGGSVSSISNAAQFSAPHERPQAGAVGPRVLPDVPTDAPGGRDGHADAADVRDRRRVRSRDLRRGLPPDRRERDRRGGPEHRPDPDTATNPVGTSHMVTATVTSTDRTRAGNTWTGGDRRQRRRDRHLPSCDTDANGQVTFTYTGTRGGDTSTRRWRSAVDRRRRRQDVDGDPGPASGAQPGLATNRSVRSAASAWCRGANAPCPESRSVRVTGEQRDRTATTAADGTTPFCYTGRTRCRPSRPRRHGRQQRDELGSRATRTKWEPPAPTDCEVEGEGRVDELKASFDFEVKVVRRQGCRAGRVPRSVRRTAVRLDRDREPGHHRNLRRSGAAS
jgi:hypothetical protein